MKKIYLTGVAIVLLFATSQAQKVISNGFPGVGVVDGTNYTRTGTIGPINYSFVTANGTMGYASSQMGGFYYVDLSSNTITDSINISTNDLEALKDTSIVLAVRGTHLYRINTANKAIDSIDVAPSLSRMELHPTKKEAWITSDSSVYVIDYSGGLSKTSFNAGHHNYDVGDIRFTAGGSIAYKVLQARMVVFKIDAFNKTVLDSATLSSNISGIEVSSDSSKLFVSSSSVLKIYVYKTSDMSLIDSLDSPREPFALYRHPTRAELWCVNHFDDSVTVYKESDYSEIAAIDLPSGPHNIAFVTGSVGVNNIAGISIDGVVYPNPATQQINISLPIGEQYNIAILDNAGRVIQSLHTQNPISTVQVAHLPAGTYHINISNSAGATQHLKWVKQ